MIFDIGDDDCGARESRTNSIIPLMMGLLLLIEDDDDDDFTFVVLLMMMPNAFPKNGGGNAGLGMGRR